MPETELVETTDTEVEETEDTSEVADDEDIQEDSNEPSAEVKDYKTEYESVQKALQKEREKNRKTLEYNQLQAARQAQLQPNDDGQVDAQQFMQTVERRMQAAMQQQQFDTKEWNQATKAYPELAEDSDIEDVVRSYRMNFMAKHGEYLSYKDAADKVLSKFKKETAQAKQDGYRAAKVSETTQKRANLDKPSAEKDNSQDEEIERLELDVLSTTKSVSDRALEKLISLRGF